VVLAARGRSTSEMTSQFDLFESLLCRLSVDIFCLSLSVEKLFNIFHLAGEFPLGAKLGVFLGILNPFSEVW
jgi:hypothetical protein